MMGQRQWMLIVSALLYSSFLLGCSSGEKRKELTKTERARLLVEVANGAIAENDPTGALQSLARAEQEDDSLPELYHSRALAYHQKKDMPQALVAAQKAVKLKSDYSEANNTLGKLLMDVGKVEDAQVYLKRAASDALFRESYKAWTNLGILKYRAGDYLESEVFLKRAIQDSPVLSCIAHYYQGHIEMKNARLSEAIKEYDQATRKSCANFADAHLALGIAYQKNKQYDRARKAFVEIQQRYPNTDLASQALDHLKYLP